MSRSLKAQYEHRLGAEFDAQPLAPHDVLRDSDLLHLPAPVRRYVARSGAVGAPKVQNMRLTFDATMWRSPGAKPLTARVVQHNFFGRPARLFFMSTRMFGLPVQVLHVYRNETATFQVRIASTLTIEDRSGPTLSKAETVTVLNDLSLFAPGALIDPRLTWEQTGDLAATVTFANDPHVVTAHLAFNDDDELTGFWSDDRPESADHGTYREARWSTPVAAYRERDGRRLPTGGDAVYTRPDGDFTYGRFELVSIAYDVARPS